VTTDPLDAIFVTTEELEGELREKLAKMILPFVRINPEKGTISFNLTGQKLATKQKVLIYLLSRLALSTRNPEFQATVLPKNIESETELPGGTVRPKLTELIREKVVFQDDQGRYSVRSSSIHKSWAILESAIPKE